MKNLVIFARVLAAGVLSAAAGAHAAATPASAETTYPSRPLRMIVTFAPGGSVDFTARMLAPKLTEAWGQQVVIDNRGGGGGIIGTELAAKAAPDGYTLLLGTSSGLVANPLLHAKLPYDAVRDFAPVSLLVVNTQLLVVQSALPVRTVKELIAYAKANPGKLAYGSVGGGSPNHLALELFKAATGTDMIHVPYKGSGPAVTELLAGQVQLMFNPPAPLLPHVKTGKLRALAVGNANRSAAMPELPTVAESGVPGFESAPWTGLFAPAQTPRAIVLKLSAQMAKILADPDLRERLLAQGSEARGTTPDALAQYMRDDTERTRKVIRAAGIKLEG